MDQIEKVAEAFTKHYYSQYESNIQNLAALYTDSSLLTYNGEKFQGRVNILQKFANLAFKKKMHIAKFDVQPSLSNGLNVLVSGFMKIDEDENSMPFTELFHLVKGAKPNQFFISNDIFQLVQL